MHWYLIYLYLNKGIILKKASIYKILKFYFKVVFHTFLLIYNGFTGMQMSTMCFFCGWVV